MAGLLWFPSTGLGVNGLTFVGQLWGLFLPCGIIGSSLGLVMSLLVLFSVLEGDKRLCSLILLGHPGGGHLGVTWD